MSQKFPLVFEEAGLSINDTTWSDLVGHGSSIIFDDLIAIIQEKVAAGYPFTIEDNDGYVIRRIDRLSDLNELVEAAKDLRQNATT